MERQPAFNFDESDAFFPSCDWEGFYLKSTEMGLEKFDMTFFLNFQRQKVHGIGTDDVGKFTWSGNYNVAERCCRLTKKYENHRFLVIYNGNVDKNGIWGTWEVSEDFKGGFHIWPKNRPATHPTAIENYSPEMLATIGYFDLR